MQHLSHPHLLSVKDLNRLDLDLILRRAKDFSENFSPKTPVELLHGRVMATLFAEPSTRTRLSFERAMLALDGQVLSITGADSSLTKGETLEDTGRVLSQFADVIVARHPEHGSIQRIAQGATVPVINAGDGIGEHPSQAIQDLYTIKAHHSNLEGLVVGIVGDLKHGRTVHSLTQVLAQYRVSFVFISHPSLQMPRSLIAELEAQKIAVQETDDLRQAAASLDALYVTRVQRERFSDIETYEDLKLAYQVDINLIKLLKPSCSILHPLPRVGEIDPAIDGDKRALYFEQVRNGIFVRMALLALLCGDNL